MAINRNKKKISDSDIETIDKFLQLIKNIHMLHDSNKGCPWHLSQTNESLLPFLSEENHELSNALMDKNKENIVEELGDILLQIMLHAEIGSKNKQFNLKDIIIKLNEKIVFRHPHIFDENKRITIEEANKIWKNQKKLEKKNSDNKKNFEEC